MMLEFDANDWDTVEASDGVSCVSPWTMLIFTGCVLFHSDAKNSAQWSWSSPIDATGPVNGPSMPIWIGFLHETVGVFAACDLAADVAVPASTSAAVAHAPPTAIVIAFLTMKPPWLCSDLRSGVRSYALAATITTTFDAVDNWLQRTGAAAVETPGDTVGVISLFDDAHGCKKFAQRVLRFRPGASRERSDGASDEVLF